MRYDTLTSENSIIRYAHGMRSHEFVLNPNDVFTDRPQDFGSILVVLVGKVRLYAPGRCVVLTAPDITTLEATTQHAILSETKSLCVLVYEEKGRVLSDSKALCPIRPEIKQLQESLRTLPPFDGAKTTHYHTSGLYARRVWRPAGVLIVGAQHRYEHLTFLLSGHMSHRQEDTQEFIAPRIFITPAGTKRATYAHTDSDFMTIHAVPGAAVRDLDKIEECLIEPEPDFPRLYDVHNRVKDRLLSEVNINT